MTATTRIRTLRAGTGLAALAALALTACASDESAEFEDGQAQAAGEVEEEAQDQAGDDVGGESEEDDAAAQDQAGDDVGGESEEDDATAQNQSRTQDAEDSDDSVAQTSEGPVDPADAVQTVEYSVPASDVEGSVTLGLHHLQVRDNTVELLLTFTPEFSSAETFNLFNLHANNSFLATPALFDRENLTSYSPLRGGSQFWSTDVRGPEVSSGETLVYWANFAVPEHDVDTINVGIPVAPEFEDVEIDWGDGEPGTYDDEDVEDEPADADDQTDDGGQ